MNTIFAGIHIPNRNNELLSLRNIDFEKNIEYLKEKIGAELQFNPVELEIVYNGNVLSNDLQLSEFMKPNATVHCFRKTKKYTPYVPPTEIDTSRVVELFTLIAHIQISVSSRVFILQQILSEYPEFRRNLGAQALIRDSVLFNTLHQPDVVKNIAKHYPIICDAAPYIVDVIKKELARSNPFTSFTETATDSTNSSEEENSLGGSSGSEGGRRGTQAEMAAIRQISRQQLQSALAQIGYGSVNSLSNIAQRNTDASSSAGSSMPAESAPLSTSASGERITSELFRSQLDRVFNTLSPAVAGEQQQEQSEQMETSDSPADNSMPTMSTPENADELPIFFRSHEYAEQLRTMAQMGFINHTENLSYLNMSNGDIESAINLLMGGMN